MASNTGNLGVYTGAPAYQNGDRPIDLLSSMPPEVLSRIQASLNPRDAHALSCANRRLRQADDPIGVLFVRFESKKLATLQEVREILAINPYFNSNQQLKLDLSSSDISDLELENIIKKFPNIIEINASRCDSLTDNGLRYLELLKNSLTSLDLACCRQITDGGVQHLATLTNLQFLNLRGCSLVTDEGVQYLVPLTNLTSLNLEGCSLTDEGLRHLASLLRLSSLYLTGCNRVTNDGIRSLVLLSELTALSLAHCNLLTDEGLRSLALLTNLTTLHLVGCSLLTDGGIQHLKLLGKLTILLGFRRTNN